MEQAYVSEGTSIDKVCDAVVVVVVVVSLLLLVLRSKKISPECVIPSIIPQTERFPIAAFPCLLFPLLIFNVRDTIR
jgi:hypothetical protein